MYVDVSAAYESVSVGGVHVGRMGIEYGKPELYPMSRKLNLKWL